MMKSSVTEKANVDYALLGTLIRGIQLEQRAAKQRHDELGSQIEAGVSVILDRVSAVETQLADLAAKIGKLATAVDDLTIVTNAAMMNRVERKK